MKPRLSTCLLVGFTILNILAIVLAACADGTAASATTSAVFSIEWTHLSSETGDLPAPSSATQQTAALILDVNKDGINDFVIGCRQDPPALVWYRRHAGGWTKYVIDNATLSIEAGGAFHDIDGDGDLDIVMGGDYQSNDVWWWENPYPNYDPGTPWTRREIKNSGSTKHHDQIFGDFDGDGQAELVFWNQNAQRLFLANVPSNPKTTQPWPYTQIYSWSSGSEHEGLARADINGDGKVDIVGGGRWFEHNSGTSYTAHVIDSGQASARVAAGQLKEGGRPEVVFGPGDGTGRLKWYEWTGSSWVSHDLLGFDVDHGHSLEVADIDGDGHLDVFCAEMRLNGGNSDAKMWVFFGDGQGGFAQTEVATGYGNHESKAGDLDGDGDTDILGKPYNWDTPRLDVWLQEAGPLLDSWQRHVVDASRPWTAIFITSADIDGDDQQDIVTGGWWYENPGHPDGDWVRHTTGSPLNNMAAVYDFDSDGDMDILGTEGRGSESNDLFVWARNNDSGSFTILDNVSNGDGDFLQGVAVERFQTGGRLEVALSWHIANRGIQTLTVPDNPATGTWIHDQISSTSQDEDLSAGDIDRDGDIDLLLGTKWLRNGGSSWSPFTLNSSGDDPDRNRLADINGDGRLDAVVGFEAVSAPGKLAWYEQGSSATSAWTEHVIATIIGPMSLDVADMDGDGDLDVVVGEHNTANPSSASLYVFENSDGQGSSWTEHLVYTGDEHHDGAQVVDIDGDGDLDIISIGWTHNRVLLYENTAGDRAYLRPRVWLPLILKAVTVDAPVTGGLQVLYTFEEGSGTTVIDRSGVGAPFNLSLSGSGTSWISGGGLAVNSATIVASAGPATKVIDACRATNEISIEGWVKPANTTQSGPARIVTLSADTHHRNFTLAQNDDAYDVRLRTTSTDLNGKPSLHSPGGSLTTQLTHVVYTRDASGTTKIYINGVQRASGTVSGDFSNWDGSYRLALANELTEDRAWLGELHYVALYNRALSQAEVSHNFDARP